MQPFDRILFPYDFSEAADAMAPAVAALAKKFDAIVTVLNAFNLVHDLDIGPRMTEPLEAPPEAVPYLPAIQELRKERERRLEEFAHARFQHIAHTTLTVDGDPARAIEWAVKCESPDLVALPTRGLGRFRRMLLGSVAAKVLHDIDCPVLTSAHQPHAALAASGECRSILCAVRLDAESEATLRLASQLARAFGAHVCLLHVAAEDERGDREASAAALDRAFREIQGVGAAVDCHVRILAADWPEGIRQTAIDEAADLVIVGRGHARASVSRVWSHLYTVIRESPCPVISV